MFVLTVRIDTLPAGLFGSPILCWQSVLLIFPCQNKALCDRYSKAVLKLGLFQRKPITLTAKNSSRLNTTSVNVID